MSFDVFFQRFRDGDSADGGRERMNEVLAPHAVRAGEMLEVTYGDGTADVHLGNGGMMANHVPALSHHRGATPPPP